MLEAGGYFSFETLTLSPATKISGSTSRLSFADGEDLRKQSARRVRASADDLARLPLDDKLPCLAREHPNLHASRLIGEVHALFMFTKRVTNRNLPTSSTNLDAAKSPISRTNELLIQERRVLTWRQSGGILRIPAQVETWAPTTERRRV